VKAAPRFSIPILVAACVFISATSARAAGNLCGTVHDASSGAAVAGAGIFVLTTSGSNTGFEGVSDPTGAFCIAGIPAGTYDLEVRRDHYATAFVRHVTVVDDVSGVDIGVRPAGATLLPPRPSPARTQVEFRFRLGESGSVRLEVFDANGRRLRGWGANDEPAGDRTVTWDLRDGEGRVVPAGVYVVRLRAAGATASRLFTKAR
jgi:hypothetical protein